MKRFNSCNIILLRVSALKHRINGSLEQYLENTSAWIKPKISSNDVKYYQVSFILAVPYSYEVQ